MLLLPDQVRMRLENLRQEAHEIACSDLIGLLEDVLPDLVALAQDNISKGNFAHRPEGQTCESSQIDPLAQYGVLACGDRSHGHGSLIEKWDCASPIPEMPDG